MLSSGFTPKSFSSMCFLHDSVAVALFIVLHISSLSPDLAKSQCAASTISYLTSHCSSFTQFLYFCCLFLLPSVPCLAILVSFQFVSAQHGSVKSFGPCSQAYCCSLLVCFLSFVENKHAKEVVTLCKDKYTTIRFSPLRDLAQCCYVITSLNVVFGVLVYVFYVLFRLPFGTDCGFSPPPPSTFLHLLIPDYRNAVLQNGFVRIRHPTLYSLCKGKAFSLTQNAVLCFASLYKLLPIGDRHLFSV